MSTLELLRFISKYRISKMYDGMKAHLKTTDYTIRSLFAVYNKRPFWIEYVKLQAHMVKILSILACVTYTPRARTSSDVPRLISPQLT